MELKFGDIISFYLEDDSCWGLQGQHTAIVLYDSQGRNLYLYHLDEDLISERAFGLKNPAIDELDNFLECMEEDSIQIIGNIAMGGK